MAYRILAVVGIAGILVGCTEQYAALRQHEHVIAAVHVTQHYHGKHHHGVEHGWCGGVYSRTGGSNFAACSVQAGGTGSGGTASAASASSSGVSGQGGVGGHSGAGHGSGQVGMGHGGHGGHGSK